MERFLREDGKDRVWSPEVLQQGFEMKTLRER
jgi:hypothetical protein